MTQIRFGTAIVREALRRQLEGWVTVTFVGEMTGAGGHPGSRILRAREHRALVAKLPIETPF